MPGTKLLRNFIVRTGLYYELVGSHQVAIYIRVQIEAVVAGEERILQTLQEDMIETPQTNTTDSREGSK